MSSKYDFQNTTQNSQSRYQIPIAYPQSSRAPGSRRQLIPTTDISLMRVSHNIEDLIREMRNNNTTNSNPIAQTIQARNPERSVSEPRNLENY